MLANIFNKSRIGGNNAELVTVVNDLQSMINEQNKMIAVLRSYLEASEARISHQIQKNLDEIKNEVILQLTELRSDVSPDAIISQMKKSSKQSKQQRNIKKIKSLLENALAEHLIDKTPLFIEKSTSKHPILTRNGKAVYNAWSKAVIDYAKIKGCAKEKYTHSTQFKKFFKQYKISGYSRCTVMADDKPITTKWAAIIIHGHAKEYTQFLVDVINNEA